MPRKPEPIENRKPSEVTDRYWLHVSRESGEYPESNDNCGKWLIFVEAARIDAVWETIKEATRAGRLGGSSKCATARPNPMAAGEKFVICVYTYDVTDEADVKRVREELRGVGITWKIPYKTDRATLAGQYRVTGSKRISTYYE